MQTGCALDAVSSYLFGRAVTRHGLLQRVLGSSSIVLAAACSAPAPAPTQAQPPMGVASSDVDGVKLALQSLAPTNPQANTADPNSFIDNHWVKALADSGFIDSLYSM